MCNGLRSGFIADVAIETNGDVVAAIEVKVTHGVTDEKQSEIDVPFIELDGEAHEYRLGAFTKAWRNCLNSV